MTKYWYIVVDCGYHDVIMGDPSISKKIAKDTAKAIQKISPNARIRTTRHPRKIMYHMITAEIPVKISLPSKKVIPV